MSPASPMQDDTARMIDLPGIAASARGLAALDRLSAFEALARYFDAQGGLTFVVALDGSRVWLSSSWASRFGGSPEEFSNDPRLLGKYVHPDDVSRLGPFVRTLQDETAAARASSEVGVGENTRVEMRLRTSGVGYQWFEVSVSTIVTSDSSAYVVGTVVDASALHEANETLMARTVAEIEANRATAAFVSKMSHELRTPLHALLGYAQLLEMGAGDATEYLSRIRRAGDHLVQLLDDLLDFSRLSAAHLAVTDEIVDLAPVLEGAFDLVRALAATHDVQLVRADDAHHLVRGDPTRIRQVLVNLLSNAVKYNRPGGTVTVRTLVHDDQQVRIEVVDTGPGIAPELLSRLFVPFDRLGAEVSNVGGAGLGLALTRGLLSAMGGGVDVESTPGEGSCFCARLPRADVDAPAELRTVVCIDDDPDARRILETLLRRLPGAEVHCAGSAAGALQLLAALRPALVVLDRHLPGQDPASFLEAVARVVPGCPLVMVSSDPEVLAPGFVQPPLVAAFAKPLDLELFIDGVTRIWSMRPA